MTAGRTIGDVLLDVEDISISFGGVKALDSVSFDVREHEVLAIIGPNGAGKSSMLNCINGFYKPQEGTITFKGSPHHQMQTHEAAEQGIARTFQNIALFKGMSTLDNIMTGRNLKMKKNFLWQALYSDADHCAVEAEVTFEDGRTGIINADLKILEAELAQAPQTPQTQAAE